MESRFTFEFRSFVFEIKQTTVFMWLNDKKRTQRDDNDTLQERDAQPSERTVACDASAGRAPANDNHIAVAWIVNCHCHPSVFVFYHLAT